MLFRSGEFEEALRGAGSTEAAAPSTPLLGEARYRGALAADGRITGAIEFEVAEGAVPQEVPLGWLPLEWDGGADTDGASGVLLHGHRTLGIVATVRRPGQVSLPWAIPPGPGERYDLHLVPAARSRIEISLPADRVPVVEGGPWVTQAEEVPPEAPSV